MSWLSTLLNILQAATVVLSFIISVQEAIYEGVAKAGEQKKRDALEGWSKAKPLLRSAIAEVLGEKWAKVFDLIFTDKVVDVMIDLLVAWFNKAGFFSTSSPK